MATQIGVCCGLAAAVALGRCDADYFELPAAPVLIPEAPDADWHAVRRQVERLRKPVHAFNVLVSGPRITGPDVDDARLRRYSAAVFARAASVGASVCVLGSAGARNVPSGWPRRDALRQVEEFLVVCADACGRAGVVLAIEPLCRAESNLVNSIGEAASIARGIRSASVGCLADTFHMEAEDEPLSEVVSAADVLVHAHTADTGRRAPGTGTYPHEQLFRALTSAGYAGRLSIECSWRSGEPGGDEVESAVAHLRSAEAASAA